jgi:t-SNARE complex subunit (syntaxin)
MPKSTSPFRFLSGLGRKNHQDVERKNNEAARKWQLRLDNFITREKGLEESIKHISNDKETLTQQLSSDFSRAVNVKQYLIPFVDEFYVIASQDFVLKNSEKRVKNLI